jgi:Flp pilus assembly protein TadB
VLVPADQLAVVLAALTGALLPHTPRADPRRVLHGRGDPRRARGRLSATTADVAVPRWLPRGLGVAAGLALLTGHGSWAAVLGAAAAALAAPGAVAASRRRHRLAASARALPRVADLLAACLQAGLPLPAAAAEVGRVVDEATARRLRHLVVGYWSPSPRRRSDPTDPADRWSNPADPAERWSDPADGWSRLERAVVRAVQRGAPLADVLAALAADERDRTRWAAEEAARRAGVRAVGPLAACFLPAFVLVGVLPVVVGVAGTVLADLR